MSGPTREQVRNLTTQAIRMTADDSAINGFSSLKDVEVDITEKYEFIYYLVKFAQEQEREECAQIADAEASIEGIAQHIAVAIRARGNT